MSYRFTRATLVRSAAMGIIFSGSLNSAVAQSTVTLYGTVDAGLIYTSKFHGPNGQNAGHLFAFNDSGEGTTSFGIYGLEDLGGGLKVEFKLESGISLADGSLNNSNGNMFGREAWLKIANNYGAIKVGLQGSPFFHSVADSDPRGGVSHFFGSSEVIYVDNVWVSGLFSPNAISYESPQIAGFTATGMTSLGGVAGDFSAGLQYSFRLKYDISVLHLDAAMYNGNAGGPVTPTISNIAFVGRSLGVSVYTGGLITRISYALYKVAGGFSSQVYGVGANYYVKPDWNINTAVWLTRDGNNSTNHSILAVVGTQYFISKRTSLYAQVGVVNNHGAMNTGLTPGPNGLFEVVGTSTGVNFGIRHNF